MENVYVVVIAYLSGIAIGIADIRTIGIYKSYDEAVNVAREFTREETQSLINNNSSVNIAYDENDWWIYEDGEIYAILAVNKVPVISE